MTTELEKMAGKSAIEIKGRELKVKALDLLDIIELERFTRKVQAKDVDELIGDAIERTKAKLDLINTGGINFTRLDTSIEIIKIALKENGLSDSEFNDLLQGESIRDLTNKIMELSFTAPDPQKEVKGENL